jgi:hypothetical protein
MDDATRARQANHGYVVGANAQATASVANLNGLAAQYAVSQFLAMVNGGDFAQWDYLHFDQFTGRTIPATTTRHEACPLCGPSGCLAEGDPLDDGPVSPARLTSFQRETREQVQPANETVAGPPAEYSLPAPRHPESPLPESPLETT